jgi:hypothetical protein
LLQHLRSDFVAVRLADWRGIGRTSAQHFPLAVLCLMRSNSQVKIRKPVNGLFLVRSQLLSQCYAARVARVGCMFAVQINHAQQSLSMTSTA